MQGSRTIQYYHNPSGFDNPAEFREGDICEKLSE